MQANIIFNYNITFLQFIIINGFYFISVYNNTIKKYLKLKIISNEQFF